MNREIKFRGQQINTKKWVYGYLYRNKGLYVICENIRYAEEEPILLDTVGQYTGLDDKNGTEIYEGDIVGDNKIKWIVKWNKHRMGFSLYPTTKQLYDEMPINVENKLGFKILGNIYDNPELLGGE